MAILKINKGIQSKSGVVTFLDVLGWKGIWQREDNPIQILVNINERLQSKAVEYSRGVDLETSVLSISDSIVLLTEVLKADDSSLALDLHGQLCAETLFLSLEQGIPLRGATGYGEFSISIENRIFVGKAIDETASWYEKADWIGVFMTPSAFYSYKNRKPKWWKRYEPPLKNGIKFETFASVWAEINIENENERISADKIAESFRILSPIVPEIINKFSNTHKFLKCLESSQSDENPE